MTHDNEFLYFDPVTIATILGAVGTAGVQAVDASKRRKIEAGLATLNAQEQKELQEKTLKAQTQQAKLQLIEDITKNTEIIDSLNELYSEGYDAIYVDTPNVIQIVPQFLQGYYQEGTPCLLQIAPRCPFLVPTPLQKVRCIHSSRRGVFQRRRHN